MTCKRLVLFLFIAITQIRAHLEISQCGKSKECIFVPHGCQEKDNCRQIFSYKGSEDGWTDMELFSTLDSPGNNYISVGFSEDDIMGDDAVTHCTFINDAAPEAHLSFNFGKSNAAPNEDEDINKEKTELELVHAHKDEHGMYCQVRQKSGKGSFFPDLNKEHQIFLARGKTRQPRALGIHSLDPASPDFPFISDKQVAVGKQLGGVGGEEGGNATTTGAPSDTGTSAPFLSGPVRFWLIKVHGILMLIAWFLLIALAILSARYLRDHFPSSSPWGLKWWFHLHRTFNILSLPFILIAVLLIFIAKDWNWTGPVASQNSEYNTNPGAMHSLFGAIAVCVAIVNPLMSLLRCAPDTGARPIFNWSHRILGIAGWISAVIAVFFAANYFVSLWSDANWSLAIVIFYIVIFVLALILFEVLSFLKSRRYDKTGAAYEMRHRGSRYDDNGKVISTTKIINTKPMHGITALYILIALFVTAITALLIVLIVV